MTNFIFRDVADFEAPSLLKMNFFTSNFKNFAYYSKIPMYFRAFLGDCF